jgi:outer membrane protein assembly factor BamB
MWDGFTGDLLITIENATNGIAVLSPVGDLLVYVFSGFQNRMRLWNSSLCIKKNGLTGSEAWQWRPAHSRNEVLDWNDGVQWDVTFPDTPGFPSARSFTRTYDGEIMITMASVTGPDGVPIIVESGYPMTMQKTTLPNGTSVYPTTANYLWTKNRTRQDNPQFIWLLLDYGTLHDGVYTYRARDKLVSYGYDASTGNLLWTTDATTSGWSTFPGANIGAYGNYYLATYDGNIYAFDMQTGDPVWTYEGADPGLDNPYGVRPFYGGLLIADNKIYGTNSEHSPTSPLWKDNRLVVVDAHTGASLWNITGWFTSHRTLVVDGIFVGHNAYDNQIYAFGKGPSKTTVSAPQTQVTLGEKVVISGTVTDQTPASKDTPAISDEDMSDWMEYIHMQQPRPIATGVPVTLSTYDPNGNFIHIAEVTSDSSGTFGIDWEPEIPGLFTVIATFAGSESYGSSFAQTYVYVEAAPEPTPPPDPTPAPMTDTYVLGMGAAAIIAIVVIGLLILVVLRKR